MVVGGVVEWCGESGDCVRATMVMMMSLLGPFFFLAAGCASLSLSSAGAEFGWRGRWRGCETPWTAGEFGRRQGTRRPSTRPEVNQFATDALLHSQYLRYQRQFAHWLTGFCSATDVVQTGWARRRD